MLIVAALHAQGLEFEVATIKPNKSGSTRSGTYSPPNGVGRFEGTNVTLRQLMKSAYGVKDVQVVGGSDWIDSDRFDVIGKLPDKVRADGVQEMLRALLGDRFKLAIHKEMRDQAIYALVVARGDGKLGPSLKVTECAGDKCGSTSTNESNGSGAVRGVSRSIDDIAAWIADRVDRDVVDRTGLTGNYDFELKYASARLAGAAPNDAPSLFTALQEQLGLKLEGARGPVEFIVIDRAERPAPD